MGHIVGTIGAQERVPKLDTMVAVAKVAPTLKAGYVRHGARGSRNYGTDADTATSLVIPFDPTQVTHPENRSRCEPGSPAPSLAKTARVPTVAFHQIQDPIVGEEVSPALGRKSSGMGVQQGSAQVRRLTPTECERLMGVPDNFTDIVVKTTKKGIEKRADDSPRYAALGNSIAVPCLVWLFRRLAVVDEIVRSR